MHAGAWCILTVGCTTHTPACAAGLFVRLIKLIPTVKPAAHATRRHGIGQTGSAAQAVSSCGQDDGGRKTPGGQGSSQPEARHTTHNSNKGHKRCNSDAQGRMSMKARWQHTIYGSETHMVSSQQVNAGDRGAGRPRVGGDRHSHQQSGARAWMGVMLLHVALLSPAAVPVGCRRVQLGGRRLGVMAAPAQGGSRERCVGGDGYMERWGPCGEDRNSTQKSCGAAQQPVVSSRVQGVGGRKPPGGRGVVTARRHRQRQSSWQKRPRGTRS